MNFIKLFCASLVWVVSCSGQVLVPDLEAARQAYKQTDYGTALKLLAPLAEKGNPAAQVLLGTMNLRGQGIPKDPDRALQWYTAAADHGDSEGQFYAGAMTFMGTAGVPHDSQKGLRWLTQAAEQGSSDAQVTLGLIHLQGGGGVQPDFIKAAMWFHLAADRGDPLAPKQLEAVEKKLTAEQIAQVNTLVASWKAKPPVRP